MEICCFVLRIVIPTLYEQRTGESRFLPFGYAQGGMTTRKAKAITFLHHSGFTLSHCSELLHQLFVLSIRAFQTYSKHVFSFGSLMVV
jgi:hypothetical protein